MDRLLKGKNGADGNGGCCGFIRKAVKEAWTESPYLYTIFTAWLILVVSILGAALWPAGPILPRRFVFFVLSDLTLSVAILIYLKSVWSTTPAVCRFIVTSVLLSTIMMVVIVQCIFNPSVPVMTNLECMLVIILVSRSTSSPKQADHGALHHQDKLITTCHAKGGASELA